jgi:hypothetical protein
LIYLIALKLRLKCLRLAVVRRDLPNPQTKAQLTLRIDSDVLEWFKPQGRGKIETSIQGCFMSNPELLAQLRQLSRAEKFQIMQFLIAELAKEEGIVMGNEAAEIMYSVHTSNSAAEQLMQLVEIENKQTQKV